MAISREEVEQIAQQAAQQSAQQISEQVAKQIQQAIQSDQLSSGTSSRQSTTVDPEADTALTANVAFDQSLMSANKKERFDRQAGYGDITHGQILRHIEQAFQQTIDHKEQAFQDARVASQKLTDALCTSLSDERVDKCTG